MTAIAMAVTCIVFAQKVNTDSLKLVNMNEVEVISTRATRKTPMAFTVVSKEEIKKQNSGKDIPYLLSMTPSAITTSDAGAGIGYTTLRIRGTDATRINVTTNGIPLNDSESHCLYWVNIPDFASSLKDIQVQRGAGSSTNGAGAFGASINMQTDNSSFSPYAETNGTYGSFNTHKETVSMGSGLLRGHWTFDARLSNIRTDGYIDRTNASLQSFYTQTGYFIGSTSIKLLVFGGKEKTYHAWNYATKKEMKENGRRFNSCGMYTDDEGNTQYYKNQNDIYQQTHYQLLANHVFSPSWTLNAALHYTKGDGYYEEYKPKASLKKYNLHPFQSGETSTSKTDLVRQKKMDNYFAGGLFGLNYKQGPWDVALGGAVNRYVGDHFGKVIWVKNYVGALSPNHEYYRNEAQKTDGNLYLKGTYNLTRTLNLYADMQYRHINYKIQGANDNYDDNMGAMQKLDINDNYSFFNPKAGVNWQLNTQNRLYASFAIAQKEPTRNNYTDGKANIYPKSEKLLDYELGYQYQNTWMSAGANFYYMDYREQLILTGELNEIGEPMAANIPDSYRAGIELSLSMNPLKWFRWDINGTLSKNRIQNFTETLYDESMTPLEIKHGSTPIAFSPDFILNNRFTFSHQGFEAALQSQYVSKQYMSNARQKEHLLDAYFVNNLHLSYTFALKHIKSITLGCSVYNLFNEVYENNGYAASYYSTSNGKPVRHNKAGYAAQAGVNVLGHVSLQF